jgi:hypothetical protein
MSGIYCSNFSLDELLEDLQETQQLTKPMSAASVVRIADSDVVEEDTTSSATEQCSNSFSMVELSNLCEVVCEPQELPPRRRGRPKGSTNHKQPAKRKQKPKPELPDYSHVDPTVIPEKILDDLKMTIYSYQAQVSGLIVDFLKLYYMLEPTIDETEEIIALHCNFAHRINSRLDEEWAERVSKDKPSSKKKTRKPVGDGTCFNTCLEIYIKINHPEIDEDKFYKMKCSSTTGQIQIPGGRLESREDCRAVVNVFLNHLKKHNICDPTAEIVSEKISMKNFKSRINIQPGLDLCTHKLSRYFYNIEHEEMIDPEAKLVEPPFRIRETKNPDECPRTSFKIQFGPHQKKDSFRVEIFNNEKKIDVGRINFKGTKGDEYAHQAYQYLEKVIRENWTYFITKQPAISHKMTDTDTESDSDSEPEWIVL